MADDHRHTDLAGRLPAQASQLYGTNAVNLLNLMSREKDGQQCVRGRILHARGVRIVQWGKRSGLVWWPRIWARNTVEPMRTGGTGRDGLDG
jgi:hypothetical protein